MTMATTLANIQARIAYRQTQDDIRRTMATLAAQLNTHETLATAQGRLSDSIRVIFYARR
jgi:hypothetical protein